MKDTSQALVDLALWKNRAKFPHNDALPRIGNNMGHVSKNTARRHKAIAAASSRTNRT